jgi:hypothetical protein
MEILAQREEQDHSQHHQHLVLQLDMEQMVHLELTMLVMED